MADSDSTHPLKIQEVGIWEEARSWGCEDGLVSLSEVPGRCSPSYYLRIMEATHKSACSLIVEFLASQFENQLVSHQVHGIFQLKWTEAVG